jgi:hypothetical protein
MSSTTAISPSPNNSFTFNDIKKRCLQGKELTLKVYYYVIEIFNKLFTHLNKIRFAPFFAVMDKKLPQVEMVFNAAACLPFVGSVASASRLLGANVQILYGFSLAAIAEIGISLQETDLKSPRRKSKPNLEMSPVQDFQAAGPIDVESKRVEEYLEKLKSIKAFGRAHLIHGCLNVFRASCELTLSAATLGIGNVALILPNMLGGRSFNPYYKYIDK